MSKQDLKPCPKCGSANAQSIFCTRHFSSMLINLAYTDYGVRCDDCGYEIHGYMHEAKAIEAWNRRTIDEQSGT